MIDTYNNPPEKEETEKTFEDLQRELNVEDNEIIDNHIHKYEQSFKEAQSRVKYYIEREKSIKEFLNLVDYSVPKNLEDLDKMTNLVKSLNRR